MSASGLFARSLRLAVLCAAACALAIVFLGPIFGRGLAVRCAFSLAAAVYLIGIAPRRTTGTTAAALTLVAGAVLLVADVRASIFAGALAIAVGVLRSSWLWPVSLDDAAAFARRFLAEIALVGGGLWFGAQLLHVGVARESFALWGFLLVQSAFFVLEGAAAAAVRVETNAVDPFEGSCRRLRAVLEERN